MCLATLSYDRQTLTSQSDNYSHQTQNTVPRSGRVFQLSKQLCLLSHCRMTVSDGRSGPKTTSPRSDDRDNGDTFSTERQRPLSRHFLKAFPKPFLHGTLEGGRHRVQQRKRWMDICQRVDVPAHGTPELLTDAFCREGSKRISAESSLMSSRRLIC